MLVLAALALASCATPVNRQARVGAYTYNQAVKDYGPPLSATKLNDGSMVVEWMTQRSQVVGTSGANYYGPTYYPWHYAYGPGWPTYSTAYFPAHFLRLEFGRDGKLKTWKEFAR